MLPALFEKQKGQPSSELLAPRKKRQYDVMKTENMQQVSQSSFGTLRIYRGSCPFLCGVDVAAALGHADPYQPLLTIRDKYKTTLGSLLGIEDAESPKERMVFVSEPGVLSLVVQIQTPLAEAFQDWVFDEVLPQIKLKGFYGSPPAPLLTLQCELDLHKAVVAYLRMNHLGLPIVPGLGELQRTSEMRTAAWAKGYTRGQPDLMIPVRSGKFCGFALELKTPKGSGNLSPNQISWLQRLEVCG